MSVCCKRLLSHPHPVQPVKSLLFFAQSQPGFIESFGKQFNALVVGLSIDRIRNAVLAAVAPCRNAEEGWRFFWIQTFKSGPLRLRSTGAAVAGAAARAGAAGAGDPLRYTAGRGDEAGKGGHFTPGRLVTSRAIGRLVGLTQRAHLLELGIACRADIFVDRHNYSSTYSLARFSRTFKEITATRPKSFFMGNESFVKGGYLALIRF
jgi:hypothetical protein